MEISIWQSLDFTNQLGHILAFGILLYPVIVLAAAGAEAALNAAAKFVLDSKKDVITYDLPEKMLPYEKFNDYIGAVVVWGVVGLMASGFWGAGLRSPLGDEVYSVEPITYIWFVGQWPLYLYGARFAVRCFKWIKKLAKAAHVHADNVVKSVDAKAPTILGDK